ncbi:MAG: translation initiation factor IF-3 [Dehalococcoidia bacterium]
MARDYRVNRRIRAPMVRVIRGEESNESVVMSTDEALQLAEEEGLDLVEVAPNQSPPVCRLLDYGRFKFIQAKKAKEAKKASKGRTELREVRMRPRISEHDLQARIRVVKRLLEDGAKVRVAVIFRGREQTHPEIAMKVLRRIAEGVAGEAKLERAPSMEARALSILLSPAQQPGQTAPQQKVGAAKEGDNG